jgi:hypothetical protein
MDILWMHQMFLLLLKSNGILSELFKLIEKWESYDYRFWLFWHKNILIIRLNEINLCNVFSLSEFYLWFTSAINIFLLVASNFGGNCFCHIFWTFWAFCIPLTQRSHVWKSKICHPSLPIKVLIVNMIIILNIILIDIDLCIFIKFRNCLIVNIILVIITMITYRQSKQFFMWVIDDLNM